MTNLQVEIIRESKLSTGNYLYDYENGHVLTFAPLDGLDIREWLESQGYHVVCNYDTGKNGVAITSCGIMVSTNGYCAKTAIRSRNGAPEYKPNAFFSVVDYYRVLHEMPCSQDFSNGELWCNALGEYGLSIGAKPSGVFGLGVLESSPMGKAFYDIIGGWGSSIPNVSDNPSIQDQLVAVWNHWHKGKLS